MSKFSKSQTSLTFLTNLIRTKNHSVLKILIKIQFHRTNLNLTNLNSWTYWQVFTSMRLKLDCEPDLQLCDLVPNFEFMLTPVSLPNLNPIPELTLNPFRIDHEIESLIVDSHIPLMDHECELKFFNLDLTIESKLTLEPILNSRVSIGSRTYHSCA